MKKTMTDHPEEVFVEARKGFDLWPALRGPEEKTTRKCRARWVTLLAGVLIGVFLGINI